MDPRARVSLLMSISLKRLRMHGKDWRMFWAIVDEESIRWLNLCNFVVGVTPLEI
jgi:hypothetical protein